MNKEIKLRVPATVANLSSGFDVLGMAVCDPFDEMKLWLLDEPVIRIIHTDGFGLPLLAEKNVAGVSLMALQKKLKTQVPGFVVEIHKHIRPGSGLGSSAASSVGAVFGANHLLGNPFSTTELLSFAMEGEKLAGGVAHADNVAPCLMGGAVLIRSYDPLDVIPLPVPELYVTLLHPQIEVKTMDARKVLPASIPLKTAVQQWGNLGALVAGFCSSNIRLISRSMNDFVAEPVRKSFIPNYDQMKSSALDAGALGGGISGSGPSVFMISDNRQTATQVERSMQIAFASTGIDFFTYVTKIQPTGVQILE